MQSDEKMKGYEYPEGWIQPEPGDLVHEADGGDSSLYIYLGTDGDNEHYWWDLEEHFLVRFVPPGPWDVVLSRYADAIG